MTCNPSEDIYMLLVDPLGNKNWLVMGETKSRIKIEKAYNAAAKIYHTDKLRIAHVI